MNFKSGGPHAQGQTHIIKSGGAAPTSPVVEPRASSAPIAPSGLRKNPTGPLGPVSVVEEAGAAGHAGCRPARTASATFTAR